ncbi:MAG TPA: ATP-dependent DNA helicase, partial [Anaeromyxobacteraceae bacterium]|nr:ATP-dependent DNA helicase [Anaeromyxobacteraceae bacterium]
AYEHRPAQEELSREVARVLERGGVLLAEAGTGTGKTLAYLVPAIQSGRQVVVSTATKTLQEQIWLKDLPLLERAGLEVSCALLKGRSNYLCLERLERFARAPTFATRDEASFWPDIEAWAEETDSGDRAELDLPDQLAVWKELSATGDTCLGRECAHYDDCFVTRARQRAAAAQLVVVNHHLFFADLAMRTSRAGAEVLPEYDAVVFDEAHALEDVATEYFGLQVSSFRVDELARDALRAVADRPDLGEAMKSHTAELEKAASAFFGGLAAELRGAAPPGPLFGGAGARGGGDAGRRGGGGWGTSARSGSVTGRGSAPGRGSTARGAAGRADEDVRALLTEELLLPLVPARERLDTALEDVRGLLVEDEAPALAQIARRAAELRVELRAVTALAEPRHVFFAEARGRGVFLRAAPIEVAEDLVERLYRRVDTAVFTSATLAAQGRFDYFRRRVGLAAEFDVSEARYAGPFDYSRQAALVVPQAIPEPSDPAFLRAAADEIRRLTHITGGRAFVLCTSTRAMRSLRELCRDLPWQLLLQGDRPKARLVELFRSEPSVLFATQSFWEGVDVPGEALSLVVIDKLPFAPPGDPVVAARVAAVDQAGGSGFGELQVPAAALSLRQGFGRLVRTCEDRGLVAVLDRRLFTKSYGRAFLATLPRCTIVRDADAARRWWEGADAPAAD